MTKNTINKKIPSKKTLRYCALQAAVLALLGSAVTVEAKDCNLTGRLAFVGVTKDGSRSAWLSVNGSVPEKNTNFQLKSLQGNEVIDDWYRSRPGLRLSLSPIVSKGIGGVHSLVAYNEEQQKCLLDVKRQNLGITFPPSWPNWPPSQKPPTGITPEVPIGVKPPIGTLPPTGITPEVPIGVKPPIGSLPPTGVMPDIPIAVTPPIGTLPPTGITPEVPVTTSSNTQNNTAAEMPHNETQRTCPNTINDETAAKRLNCVIAQPSSAVPLTAGRDFQLAQIPTWNTWLDARYFNTTDERNDLDIDGNSNAITLGGDRIINNNGDLAVGMMLSLLDGRNDGFSGSYSTRVDGISAGPYLAYRFATNWSLDTTLLYGQSNTDVTIAEIDGSFDSQQYQLASTATGQYALNDTYFRPKLTLSYSYNRNDSYDLAGQFANQTLRWNVDDDTVEAAAAESVVEINQLVRLQSGKVLVPYVEVGLHYDIKQPGDGEIIDGDLQAESVSRWTGSLRLGNRFYVTNTTYLELSAGYLSFAQNGLDVWEGRFYLSHVF